MSASLATPCARRGRRGRDALRRGSPASPGGAASTLRRRASGRLRAASAMSCRETKRLLCVVGAHRELDRDDPSEAAARTDGLFTGNAIDNPPGLDAWVVTVE